MIPTATKLQLNKAAILPNLAYSISILHGIFVGQVMLERSSVYKKRPLGLCILIKPLHIPNC